MLLRGANAVGYTNYPDNLIREFVKEAARSGIDVFRIFDSLNWVPGMEVAMDQVLQENKLCEATICYTGDILDPKRDKYTLQYYVNLAKELERRGAHLLAIKDMSGLLKPYAAKKLVSTLKQEVGLPSTSTPTTPPPTRWPPTSWPPRRVWISWTAPSPPCPA